MILFSLLSFALITLLVITLIFLRNWTYIKPIHEFDSQIETTENPFVSIGIPARNEIANIHSCVRSSLNQTYANVEVLVLDDESTDGTSEALQQILENSEKSFTILHGKPKPDGWLGKNWACHQLSKLAKGELILFIDADVTLEPHVIDALVQRFEEKKHVGLITVWPQQILVSFWETVLVPMVYYTLFGFLFLRYTESPPRWMPKFLLKSFWPLFAAACGQFMAFRKEIYDEIGGHEAVKNQVVEDVELARLMMKSNHAVFNQSGKDAVYCRMYRSYDEIYQGFRKNFFAGFGYSYTLFLFAGFLHFIVFLLPIFMLLFYSIHQFWYGFILAYCVVIIPIFHRYLLHMHFDWKIRHIFSHFIGVIWFHLLSVVVMKDKLTGKKSFWKGRTV